MSKICYQHQHRRLQILTFRLLASSEKAIDLDLCLSSEPEGTRETAAISSCSKTAIAITNSPDEQYLLAGACYQDNDAVLAEGGTRKLYCNICTVVIRWTQVIISTTL